MNALTEKTELKTPSTRLLDLLAGWTEFVDNEEGKYPDTLSSEEIGALYQQAGELASRDYADIEAERDAICRFVTERLLTTLLKA